MREKVLLLAWPLFMAVATFWLPAYSGTIVASEMLGFLLFTVRTD